MYEQAPGFRSWPPKTVYDVLGSSTETLCSYNMGFELSTCTTLPCAWCGSVAPGCRTSAAPPPPRPLPLVGTVAVTAAGTFAGTVAGTVAGTAVGTVAGTVRMALVRSATAMRAAAATARNPLTTQQWRRQARGGGRVARGGLRAVPASVQGLTLVHFSAFREHFCGM